MIAWMNRHPRRRPRHPCRRARTGVRPLLSHAGNQRRRQRARTRHRPASRCQLGRQLKPARSNAPGGTDFSLSPRTSVPLIIRKEHLVFLLANQRAGATHPTTRTGPSPSSTTAPTCPTPSSTRFARSSRPTSCPTSASGPCSSTSRSSSRFRRWSAARRRRSDVASVDRRRSASAKRTQPSAERRARALD